MAKCIVCGKEKKITDFNYAGFDIKKEGNYPFPERIDNLILPGDKKKGEFLCAACASKIEVKCKVHGPIKDDIFAYGKPPRCKKCEEQVKSINKGILPEAFLWLAPLTMIYAKTGNIRNRGFLAASADGELHIINNDVLYSANIESFSSKVTKKNGAPIFVINIYAGSNVSSCEIDLNDPSILRTAAGTWFKLWGQGIADAFNIKIQIDQLWLISIEWQTISDKQLSSNTEKYPVAICLLRNNKLLTFPKLSLPSLKNIKYWRTVSDEKSKGIELVFNIEEIPQVVRLRQLYSSEGPDQIGELKASLPSSARNDEPKEYYLSHTGIFEGRIYPDKKKQRILLQVVEKNVFATLLPEGQKISFSKGFSYSNTYLFISNDSEILTIELNKKDKEIFSNAILAPKQMFKKDECQWGFFFDKDKSSLVHKLSSSLNSFTVDGSSPVSSSNIDEISVNKLNKVLCEVILRWKEDIESKTLKLVSPELLAYETLEILEVSRAAAQAVHMSTPDLYPKYNLVKKSNLLIRLFADIILLKRKLDEDLTMSDLAEKLNKLDATSFYQNKGLKELTTQKILLLSFFLPKIKQNFEYLSSLYPYYQLKNEAHFLGDAFGNDVANTIIANERKRIVLLSRRNVQSVQSKIQKAILEIERAIRPVEEGFASDDIQKTMSSRITRNTPLVAQILLVGGILGIGAGSGVGILAGMLGIRALGDLLNKFQKNHIDAARIKRAMETVFSWWQVLLDTLPVTIFEAGELIDEENIRCIKRDREIFDSLPSPRKAKATETLNHALRRRIEEGTRDINCFIESEQGGGISIKTIESDINSAIRLRMPEIVDNYSESLTLVPKNNF
jgi:hypothetical protein